MTDRELYLRIRRSNNSRKWLRCQYELLNQPVPEYLKNNNCRTNNKKKSKSYLFCELYKKHHNITVVVDIKDYRREYMYYRRHGNKCRWE